MVNRDQGLLDEMQQLGSYIADELNVQQVNYSSDEAAYIEWVAKPNFPVLGKRLGKRMKTFQQAIRALTTQQIAQLGEQGEIVIEDETFNTQEIEVLQQAREGTDTVSNSKIAVDLDCQLTPELIRGGYAREVVNRVQRARKELGFDVSDRIVLTWAAEGDLAQAIEEHREYIMGEVLALELKQGAGQIDAEVAEQKLLLGITRAGITKQESKES